MTSIRPLSEFPLLAVKRYFPQGQIEEVKSRFGVVPHEEASQSGIPIETDSTKGVWVVNLSDRDCREKRNFAVKVYQGLTPRTQQSVIYELDARIIANLVQLVAKEFDSLHPHADDIFIPTAIGYEYSSGSNNGVVLVTDFVDGALHLDTELAKSLPPEVRALGFQIPLFTGVRQFSTSSFLCRWKTEQSTGRKYLEVAPIDLESLSQFRELDHNTKVLFHLLRSASQGSDIHRFTGTLQDSGNAWLKVMRSGSNRDHLAFLIGATRGGVIIPETMSPGEIAQNTLDVVEYYRSLDFVLQDVDRSTETLPTLHVRERVSSAIDLEYSLEKAGGDEGLLCELMELGLTEFEASITRLRSAIKTNDFRSIQREAHTLKGMLIVFTDPATSNEISAIQAHRLALRVERMGQDNQEKDQEGSLREACEMLNVKLIEIAKTFKIFLGKPLVEETSTKLQ